MIESQLLFGLGMQEILIIAFVVLLLFGGKKIPELMKGLGKGVKSFKEGMNEVTDISKDEEKSEESKRWEGEK
jgi:sec-independent protein translocase protein TatA